MRVDGHLRLGALEHQGGILGLCSPGGSVLRFMHEHVHAARLPDEVVARARVAREHERAAVIVEAIAERLPVSA